MSRKVSPTMNHALLRAADKLDLALRQIEHAQTNLRSVEMWAHNHNHPRLSMGTHDLPPTAGQGER
jgi:hypothetical protein